MDSKTICPSFSAIKQRFYLFLLNQSILDNTGQNIDPCLNGCERKGGRILVTQSVEALSVQTKPWLKRSREMELSNISNTRKMMLKHILYKNFQANFGTPANKHT